MKVSRRVALQLTGGMVGFLNWSHGSSMWKFVPKPTVSPLRKAELGTPVRFGDNTGDTWVAAWATDGKLYSPANDTTLFKDNNCRPSKEATQCNSNIAFNRLVMNSDLTQCGGKTVNAMSEYGKMNSKKKDHCSWKSSGCIWVDGGLYLVVARHLYGEDGTDPYRRQIAKNASIIKSFDHGRTWVRSAKENFDRPMFPGRRFATPYFVQFGYGHRDVKEHNADEYIYAVSNDGFWDCGNNMILGRVKRVRLAKLDAQDWEYYCGGDGMANSSWTRDSIAATHIVSGIRKHGMTGAVYLPEFSRYLMIGWYYPAGGGKLPGASTKTVWDFYEAPRPWGPWTSFGSFVSSPAGWYSPQICPKYLGNNSAIVLTAGDFKNPDDYRLTAVPLHLSG